jgi:hypothetical protein
MTFVPGQSGNPRGRPIGSRVKLGETFLGALVEDFNALAPDGKPNGVRAIQRAREEDPASYCKTLASILPKEVTGENGSPLKIMVVTGVTRSDDN